jgi:hypothetical protein
MPVSYCEYVFCKNIQHCGKVFLLEVSVLSQIPYVLINHNITSGNIYVISFNTDNNYFLKRKSKFAFLFFLKGKVFILVIREEVNLFIILASGQLKHFKEEIS